MVGNFSPADRLRFTMEWLGKPDGANVRKILDDGFPSIENAFILHHHQDQGEDIFIFLVNSNFIAEIDIDDHHHMIEITNLPEYIRINKKMPKHFRRLIQDCLEFSRRN
ncbi:hypothetical protein [Ensifer adhaerens]|uniref:hypothetical protein n=1 Tax=Ensifer adhaerens TaxID=106592 RepID=UPI001319FDA7|nr:hypothetical protein [Ensifer adhaerens]